MKTGLYFGPLVDKEERKTEILEILSRGKAVRFSRENTWKDINEFKPDDLNDLIAFRRSENTMAPYICWDAAHYTITEVDI